MEPAAAAVQCAACNALVTVAWRRIMDDLLAGRRPHAVGTTVITSYLEHACEEEAVEAVLAKYTIYKASMIKTQVPVGASCPLSAACCAASTSAPLAAAALATCIARPQRRALC